MIQIKPFTQIFKTDGDRTTFIKLLRDASSSSSGRFIENAMKTYAMKTSTVGGSPKNPSYLKMIKEKYNVVKDMAPDANGSNLLENLAQSTGIDKLDIYSLYFRNLVVKHSVEKPSLLTDGIEKMLSCKTSDELNALGIETFGDEWPVSEQTRSTTCTLKAVDACVNYVKFSGYGSELPVFSAPIPYPELYDSVSEEDLPMYAADLTAAVVLMCRMLAITKNKTHYLLADPISIGMSAFDDRATWSAAAKNTIEAVEHLLFICLVEVRRAAASESCTIANPLYIGGLEQFMLKQGLGEEYLYMAMRCKCSFCISDNIFDKLGATSLRGVPFFGLAQLEIKLDKDFINRSLADNKSLINNIMMPLLKGEYIKSCVVPHGILTRSFVDGLDDSYALVDISSQKVRIKINSLISYLASQSDDTIPEDAGLGVYPAIYMGGRYVGWSISVPNADDGKKCFRSVQSVGSLVNNPAFDDDCVIEVGDCFESGDSVVDGLLTLINLHRLCSEYGNVSEDIFKAQQVLELSTGMNTVDVENSIMKGTSRLALILQVGKIYNLGTYLSAGVQISLIFQMPDYDGKYYLCVDTEEQKEIVDALVQEALRNSDYPEEFNYLIHVCGNVTDPVWLPGGTLFGADVIMSGNSLPEELLKHTDLLALLAYKYVDSHFESTEAKLLGKAISTTGRSRTDIGILCACTTQDKQLGNYASDDFDMEEHFVVATGGVALSRWQTVTGSTMRRRGHCYLTMECIRLMPDGTLTVEIPNKGVYFVSLKDDIWGAFYISEGYMKMLYLSELVAYIPEITAAYETILAMPYQAKLRLAYGLSATFMEDGDV